MKWMWLRHLAANKWCLNSIYHSLSHIALFLIQRLALEQHIRQVVAVHMAESCTLKVASCIAHGRIIHTKCSRRYRWVEWKSSISSWAGTSWGYGHLSSLTSLSWWALQKQLLNKVWWAVVYILNDMNEMWTPILMSTNLINILFKVKLGKSNILKIWSYYSTFGTAMKIYIIKENMWLKLLKHNL